MLKRVVFIVNPISGLTRRPAQILHWIEKLWSPSGIDYEIQKTNHRGHGTELARRAAQSGVDMVVACGGDGTINEVGHGLVGSATALGVVPAGSGNGFARNLRIPLKVREAVEALLNPRIRTLDVGRINGRYFFNIAGAGIDAEISFKFDRLGIRGPLPYFFLGFREYVRFQPQPLTIHLPDRDLQRAPILLSFANLPEFGVNAVIAPRARPTDGLIDVCVVNPVPLPRALLQLPKLFNGRIEQVPEVEIFQAPAVEISRAQDGPIHTDGDPHQESAHLKVEALAGQLQVALPRREIPLFPYAPGEVIP